MGLNTSRRGSNPNYVVRAATRIARWFFAWGRVSEGDFKPATLLEAIPDYSKKRWRSLGKDAAFVAERSLPPGWARVTARIKTEGDALPRLFHDVGEGFETDDALSLVGAPDNRPVIKYVRFSRTVRGLKLEPIGSAGEFTLERLTVEPISGIRMWLEALWLKIEDMRTRRNFGRSLKYGLVLMLKLDFSTFREKFFPPEMLLPQKQYEQWRTAHAITIARRSEMCAEIDRWKNPPLISVIMPVYNVPELYLRKAIESVLGQIYQRWELCIADDRSTAAHVRPVLEEYAKKDSRIKVVSREKNGNISAATNSALELATGEFVATLDNDDEFTEHALFEVAKAIVADPAVDFIYSDEDKLDMNGRCIDPFFKPDWSPEYFLACMYTCHIGVYRTALVREIGGYRSEFDSAQDYDLVLRVVGRTKRIKHIPDVLYHWRMLPSSTASGSEAKPKAHLVAQKALAAHLVRMGEKGRIEDGPSAGFHRARFEIVGKPKVSILIPSTCASKMEGGKEVNYLQRCVASILEKSTWSEFEIIVLDRNQMPAEMEARFAKSGVRRVSYSEAFNWSRVNNLGARHATGSHLLLLNDDMEVLTPDWLETMLELSQRAGVGAVGAKLFFPDGRLQHVGVTVLNCKPGHPYYRHPGGTQGYFMGNVVHRNCVAVTGACLMTRKEVFESVGGLNEDFPLNYNDVDYCLKLISHGLRVIFSPHAQLYHYESISRPKGVESDEAARFEKLWKEKFPMDPYTNPNLTIWQAAWVVKP